MKMLSPQLAAFLLAISCTLPSTLITRLQCFNKSNLFSPLARRLTALAAACGLLVALTAGPTQAQTCTPPPQQADLVSWWSLDETTGTAISDHTGLNPGTATSSIGSSSSSSSIRSFPGTVGTGLNFWGSGRVKTVHNGSLDFGMTNSFTIDAWIKGTDSPIVVNYNLTTRHGYSVYIRAGNLTLDMDNGAPAVTSWTGPPIAPNVWTFIAVVVDRITNKVTFYTPVGSNLTANSPLPLIVAAANATSGQGLEIGGCGGNPLTCTTVIDELEIFKRALTQPELQTIFAAGSAGKCVSKGMTWQRIAVNTTDGTVTVGCGNPPNRCDPYIGDRPCTDVLPLLCFKPLNLPKPTSVQEFPNSGWSGGIVATTGPVAASSFNGSLASANARCEQTFGPTQLPGPPWRVAEFHDGPGTGWNFQAYGNVGQPASRFWLHINDQPKGTCFPN
jgi:Concanavalin A-like lectin/glucanases superfamily